MKTVFSQAAALVAAFVIGCAAAPLVVPPLSAQNAEAGARQWEYTCTDRPQLLRTASFQAARDAGQSQIRAIGTALTQEFGAAGWELAGVDLCFKRPL
ncbi:MAG: hypothetical protein AAGH15_24625 [Myxococcota bacterium]